MGTQLRWGEGHPSPHLLFNAPWSTSGSSVRFWLLSAELQRCIEGLALQKPPLSIAAIHRQVNGLAKKREEPPPCYAVVNHVVLNLPSALTTLAQEGDKTYAQRFDLIHRREAEAPNAIWQADHCLLDILLVREGAEPARPWMTVIEDDYSEERLLQHNWREGPLPEEPPRTEPTWAEIGFGYREKRRQIVDPTNLVIVDEADRLRMSSLEQMRAIFDVGDIGLEGS